MIETTKYWWSKYAPNKSKVVAAIILKTGKIMIYHKLFNQIQDDESPFTLLNMLNENVV